MDALQTFWQDNAPVIEAAGLSLLVLVGFGLVAWLLKRFIAPAILKHTDPDKHPLISQLVQGFQRPVVVYLRFAGLCCAVLTLSSFLASNWQDGDSAFWGTTLPQFVYTSLRIGAVIAVSWGLLSSSGISSLLLRNARSHLNLQLSRSFTRFLAGLYKVLVVIVAIVTILKELDFDIVGLMTSLGIGGLTIALAAKDLAASFFGGLVLVIEKPFEIGDSITCSDVEGTVVNIGMRSTSIRTADGALTTLSNATLADEPITNWTSGMNKRRADFTLQLAYDTPRPLVRRFVESIKTLLNADADIVAGSAIVRLFELGTTGLGVRVRYFATKIEFADFSRVMERVNYGILELAEKQGVTFVLPAPAAAPPPARAGKQKKE